jgi:hypothetical protein
VETRHVSPPLAGFLVAAFPFLCSAARSRHFSGRRLRAEKSRSWRLERALCRMQEVTNRLDDNLSTEI